MISRTGMHALNALVSLQHLPAGRYAGAGQIARQIRAPSNYLGKLLRQLARAGIVEGRKGSSGGFRLAGGRHSVSLFDAIDPIEHFDRLKVCLLGRPKCRKSSPCPLHEGWSLIRERFLDFLQTTTLSDLSENATSKGRRKSGLIDRAARSAAGGVS